MADWSLPTEVTELDLAFPARGVELTPPWDDIPRTFCDQFGQCKDVKNTVYFKAASKLFSWYAGFSEGLDLNLGDFEIKEGVDPKKMQRHLQVALLTYGTQHEHKIAGVAYLLSLWTTMKEEKSV